MRVIKKFGWLYNHHRMGTCYSEQGGYKRIVGLIDNTGVLSSGYEFDVFMTEKLKEYKKVLEDDTLWFEFCNKKIKKIIR